MPKNLASICNGQSPWVGAGGGWRGGEQETPKKVENLENNSS